MYRPGYSRLVPIQRGEGPVFARRVNRLIVDVDPDGLSNWGSGHANLLKFIN
jgi:hypothetical protein